MLQEEDLPDRAGVQVPALNGCSQDRQIGQFTRYMSESAILSLKTPIMVSSSSPSPKGQPRKSIRKPFFTFFFLTKKIKRDVKSSSKLPSSRRIRQVIQIKKKNRITPTNSDIHSTETPIILVPTICKIQLREDLIIKSINCLYYMLCSTSYAVRHDSGVHLSPGE